MFDSVSKVMGIFTKLIERLEKIKAKQQVSMEVQSAIIEDAENKFSLHEDEVRKADAAIAKLKDFTS